MKKNYLSLGLTCVLLAGTAVCTPALGQIKITATSSVGGGFGGDGQVQKRNIERYSDLLNFTPEQKDSALTVYEGYAAGYQEAQKARRAAMEDLRRSSEDTGDHTVFMEKIPKVEGDFKDKTAKLEKELFSDLRALVSGAAQEQRWPKVERMRRREVGLRNGVLSGEGVDLTEVVAGLKLPADAMTTLAVPLDEYESELDHQIQDRSKAVADAPKFEPGKPLDFEVMKKQMAAAREAGEKVREVNERNARKIEPLLPEDKRAAFRDAVKLQSFPQVYRPSRSLKDIDAALKLDDLTASQRSQLNDLRAAYQHDARPLNDAWASAIKDNEVKGQGGAMMDGMGGRMVINMADDPPALADARKARRELDDKTNDKVKGVLNEGQRDKLSKARSADDEDGGGGGAVRGIMLRTDDR